MTRVPIRGDPWVGEPRKSCHRERKRSLLKLTQTRSNRVNVSRSRINFKTQELDLTFSCFKSREKEKKCDSSLLRMFNELEVTKCSFEPFLLGSPKRIKSDYSGELGKGFTRQSVKLHIHLGSQMKTKDFPYGSQSSRMLCSVHYGL